MLKIAAKKSLVDYFYIHKLVVTNGIIMSDNWKNQSAWNK